MKRLWSAAALLLVLLGGALWNAWYADRLSGRMAGQLEQAQELADRGDWEGAARLSRESFGLWQAHDAYLHVMMRHSDTDQILRGFRALDQYLALEESDQYTAANAELICQLELLSEMEQPSLVNIFLEETAPGSDAVRSGGCLETARFRPGVARRRSRPPDR